jgi:hypothetical protein
MATASVVFNNYWSNLPTNLNWYVTIQVFPISEIEICLQLGLSEGSMHDLRPMFKKNTAAMYEFS